MNGIPGGTGAREAGAPADRYQVIDARRGGMGVVYLCHDRDANRPVALKTFLPEDLNNPATRVRFLQEAANWVALGSHPHIVRAYRVEQLGRPAQPHVVMDWVVGRGGAGDPALAARLHKRPPLPFGRSLRYALHVARGMRHARQRIPGLVHRDLKPGNILIGGDDLARVTDFGLARSFGGVDGMRRAVGHSRHRDRDGKAPGTAPYCAPEQWDTAAIVDERADIYALGCIVFEMLTGRRAAEGNHPEVRDIHLRGRLAPLPAALPDRIAQVIRRCTARYPDGRFTGWEELEAGLIEVYTEVTGEAAPREPMPESEGCQVGQGDTYRALARSYLDLGHWRPAIECLEHSAALAHKHDDLEQEAEALHDLGLATMQAGRHAEAERVLRRALGLARKSGNKQIQSDALSTLGSLRARLGQYVRARSALKCSIRLARQRNDIEAELTAFGNLANTCAESGDPGGAVEHFERLLDRLTQQPGSDPAMQQRVLGNLGAALVALGEPERAVPRLECAHQLAEQCGDIPGRLHILGDLCQALALQRDGQRLAERAQAYLKLAIGLGDSGSESRARRFIRIAKDIEG